MRAGNILNRYGKAVGDMGKYNLSRLHRRLDGLAEVIDIKLSEDAQGGSMSDRERSTLRYILSRMESMLRDDRIEAAQRNVQKAAEAADLGQTETPCRNSRQYLNTQCEFFDLDANRIRCAIGCDMYRCRKKCIYATNVPGTLPPYCTKYMKGWIEK